MSNTTNRFLMAAAGAGAKTYVDDVFSTYLYKGNGNWTTPTPPLQTINTGLDMSGEGGLLWLKQRAGSGSSDHILLDTVRGANKTLKSSTTAAETTVSWGQTFTTTGFTLNNSFNDTNANNETYASWSFRKAKGFFDIVTYTGSGATSSSPQSINHSLKSIPGMIIIKNLTQASQWFVYHKSLGEDKFLQLNKTDAAIGYNGGFKTITSSSIDVFDSNSTPGNEFVAYLFAAGDTGLRNSVDFDGNDYLTYADDKAWQLGTGDWTMECFWKSGSGNTGGYQQLFGTQTVWGPNNGVWRVGTRTTSDQIYFSRADGGGFEEPVWNIDVNDESWHHLAFTRASGYVYCWVDGVQQTNVGESNNITGTMTTNNSFRVGQNGRDGTYITGKVSNLRIVKGRAVYTNGSNFTTPTEPLPTVSNTIFLGCDASSVTSSSLSAKVPTVTGDPTVSTDNPFTTDAASAVFGADGDKDILKVGSYTGNGSSCGPEINVGWEPQYVLVKNTSSSGPWMMFDSMRGITDGSSNENDSILYANTDAVEGWMQGGAQYLDLTATGFELRTTNADVNEDAKTFVYIAIRRPDGDCGKPIEDATKCFAMDTGAGSSTIPNYDSGFPVDFALFRQPASSENWHVVSRSTFPKYLLADASNPQADWWSQTFDSNIGFSKNNGQGSSYQAWMWKRHAGFDVQAYTGTNANATRSHGLGKVPEMMWVKRRDATSDWAVYHKDLNQYPQDYYLKLNSSASVINGSQWWKPPTSTQWFTAIGNLSNINGNYYINMLFASVDGISKVGSYDGTGVSGLTITTGFAPRFLIIKNYTWSYGDWFVYDTTRGWASGTNGEVLNLNGSGGQSNSGTHKTSPTSTGFSVDSTDTAVNVSGQKYIYYAHA